MINEHSSSCGNIGRIIRGQVCECAQKRERDRKQEVLRVINRIVDEAVDVAERDGEFLSAWCAVAVFGNYVIIPAKCLVRVTTEVEAINR